MEDYFASIIFGSIDIRLLSIMIVTGFLIFIMYFYRSELWDSFSDFDKLSFSITCGFIVLLGLVIPLARIIFTLNYFFNGYDFVNIGTEEIIRTYKQICSFLLFGIFVLLFISHKPLYENERIFKKIFVGYLLFVIFLSFLDIELVLAIMFTQFRDYYPHVNGNISTSIFFMSLFFCVYLAVHKKSIPAIFKEIKLLSFKCRMKKRCLFLYSCFC
ncbi:hypothetical protein HWN40_03990 [Methanolobus zinderi]|uniref:Uncharacterized protein n=1 Tax=Methanolobus zinderi TaxID=536044 RepID=A0A7D5E770_9EURY|nr:hypothetical protein [Methanolobus zinderi]QLC49478.1 hypothetical protein HWN40_03990 [Methanolobus zinderi]